MASFLNRPTPTVGRCLVDEAHNFRNINQRSKGLNSYLESGDHKVISAQRHAPEPGANGHLSGSFVCFSTIGSTA